MKKEYIIGREGNQNFEIDDTKYNAVSRKHARLTVDEAAGEWLLCDNNSANGTFIIDSKGALVQITDEVRITPTTRICLGGKRYNALTIVAHAVVDGGKTFGPDFDELESKLMDFKARVEKKRKMMWFRRIALSLLPVVFLLIPGIDMMGRIVGVTVASVFNAVLSGFDNQNSMNEERSRTIVCPKCGRALTDKDVERHCCPCGAH